MTAPARPPALSRPVSVVALADVGRDVMVEASLEECIELAKALGLVSVKSLRGQFLVKSKGTSVTVTGTVVGVVTQTCTVSLEPFEAAIDEKVDLQFLPETGIAAWMTKHRPDPNEDLAYEIDPPDAIVDGKIDLGAVASEFLALGLDPYPRKPGVAFEPAPYQAEKEPSPFAALARLKDGT